jgi:hypothetical protein
MKNPHIYPWHTVSGIDTDGESIRQRLDELVNGALSYDEQIELLADLCRDGRSSTAGYAATPFLLHNNCVNLRTRWEMIHAAGMIIHCSTNSESPSRPPDLKANLDHGVRSEVRGAILKAAAEANLGPAELTDSLSIAVSMWGRDALAEQLANLEMKEYEANGM